MHTENLTILFVDIAGFTVTTSRLSRQENADLIQTFGRVLLPLIKGYKGKLIKSIGDAYLITFLSPTDAMLCSMALQDAMHGNNLNVIEEEKIHIRVAANLGEVRVAKNDIFGEPVNVASRIEGVTPADAIYLSEAVYMAMNKAEVPVEEVGFQQLAGVSQSVRLYCIPRFSVNRLVPEKNGDVEVGNELVYPYGGMHCHANNDNGFTLDFAQRYKKTRLSLSVLLIVISVFFLSWYFNLIRFNTLNSGNVIPVVTPAVIPSNNVSTKNTVQESHVNNNAIRLNIKDESLVKQTESVMDEKNKKALSLTVQENAVVAAATKRIEKPKPTEIKKIIKSTPIAIEVETPASIVWNVRNAKLAYRNKTLNKTEYQQVIRDLKLTYKKNITKIKEDYNSNKITKNEYKIAVTKAKNEYKGN
nr:adenylate/guanylate cyclase domain-containing protein [Colwellia sp. 75C3]